MLTLAVWAYLFVVPLVLASYEVPRCKYQETFRDACCCLHNQVALLGTPRDSYDGINSWAQCASSCRNNPKFACQSAVFYQDLRRCFLYPYSPTSRPDLVFQATNQGPVYTMEMSGLPCAGYPRPYYPYYPPPREYGYPPRGYPPYSPYPWGPYKTKKTNR